MTIFDFLKWFADEYPWMFFFTLCAIGSLGRIGTTSVKVKVKSHKGEDT